MGDSYLEILIEREHNQKYATGKKAVYALCVVCVLLSVVISSVFFFIAVALGLVGFFVIPDADYEFEYLLLNKELSVDKIIAKSKRKSQGTFDLNKMEFMCPLSSHELDSFKNKKTPVLDFSSAKEGSQPYVIVYRDEKGDKLIYVENNEELLTYIKGFFPRKIIQY